MDASGSRYIAAKYHRSMRTHRQLIWGAILIIAVALIFFAARAAYSASEIDWTQTPVDQRIPVTQAEFDKGGYLLRTRAGSLIVVPFTAGNLFAMKFGVSANESTSFENEGSAPALFLPKDASLENAVVPNARWQPFSPEFRPQLPVFVGMAPNWPAFVSMSWYPDMTCIGGYWTATPYHSGSIVIAAVDLMYVVDGRAFDGWQSYRNWSATHQSGARIAVADPSIYRRAAESRRLFAHRKYGRE
jgi:hypothetical protein